MPTSDTPRMQDLAAFDASRYTRGASAAREWTWLLVRGPLFGLPWLRAYALKRAVLRAFGATIGAGVVLKPAVRLAFPWRLEVGAHSWLGENAWLLNLAPIRIGAHVCISQRALLCTGNHDWSRTDFALRCAPICIEDEVWIGANAFVGPGVTIGRGSVVTAGSVVTRSLPPGMICSGNPCVPVKPRPTTAPDTDDDTSAR